MVKLARRAQAAMEFLMTYGWAIMVVLIAIAALAYFGILSPAKLMPSSCILFPGMACADFLIAPNSIQLVIQNGYGKSIIINSLNVIDRSDGSSCNIAASGDFPDGQKKYITAGQCDNGVIGKRFRGKVNINYLVAGVSHNYEGSLSGPVEKAGSSSCDATTCTATPEAAFEEDYSPYIASMELQAKADTYATFLDEGIVKPDHVVIQFPALAVTTLTSSSVTITHRENLPGGCNLPAGVSDQWRHNVTCYSSGTWKYLGLYSASASFVDSSYNLATCVTTPAEANNVAVKITFDPTDSGSGVCGSQDIDYAQLTVVK